MSDLLRLLKLFRPYTGWIALGIFASLATLIANVTLMAVSGWFVASMAVAGAAQVSMNYFTPAGIIRAMAMLRTGGRYGERLVTHEATLRLLSTLRVWFYQRLEPLAPARLQEYRSGDLLSRIRADVDTLDHFYLRLLVPVVTALFGSLLFVFVAWRYDPQLALVLASLLLLAGVLLPWAMQRLGRGPGARKIRLQSELRAQIIDGIQGLAELQVYGAAETQAKTLAALSEAISARQGELSALHGSSQALLVLCAHLAMWLGLWSVIPLVQDGRLAPPDLAMLTLFLLAAFEAVLPLPAALQALGETRAAARRIFEIVDAEPRVIEPAQPKPFPDRSNIVFRNAGFSYPASEYPVLNEFNLEIAEGEKVALTGPTGAGKSTVTALLLKFWAVDAGEILIGDTDLSELASDDVRRHIAVVSQHTQLFTGSVRENLLLGSPGADAAALEQACRDARIHDFIVAQADGYDTWLGEAGLTLSGGQARRLAIARALLKKAPILILDEPTEGLDSVTGRDLMDALIRVTADRSLLLITHRREGLAAMDRIVEMGAAAGR